MLVLLSVVCLLVTASGGKKSSLHSHFQVSDQCKQQGKKNNNMNIAAMLDIPCVLQKHIDDTTTVGIAVGFIDKGVITYYACGKKDIGACDPVDEHTIFEIGSITKVFTALALLDMAREGLIKDIDSPIDTYMPGVYVPQKNGKKITFRHLATHTSGLPRLPDNIQVIDQSNPKD